MSHAHTGLKAGVSFDLPAGLDCVLVEDCNKDAELIGAALQLGGMDNPVRRTLTEDEFRSALAERVPDIILSDYSLPQFNGLRSLEIAREMCPDTPFILISGTKTEGQAADMLNIGATDYVLKHHMERLVPCVRRALHEAAQLRERRRVEAALRESEARLHHLLAGSPGIIYSCALRPAIRHTYVSGNVEALLGYNPEEFLADANFWRDRLHPADALRVFNGLSLLLECGSHTEEYRFLHNDGTWRWMRDEMRLISDEAGKPAEIIGCCVDVTESRVTDAEAERCVRLEAVAFVAGGVAHDLNNALSPVFMGVSMLRLPELNPADRDEAFNMIESSARRGADIAKQLLTFARSSDGHRVNLNPHHSLKEIERICVENLPKTIITRLDAVSGLWMIHADPAQIDQMLLNLAINARDAMSEGGTLTIGAGNIHFDDTYCAVNPEAKPGPHVVFRVSDTGTGIPAELREKIFDPFFTTKKPGTGLGLATVANIVRAHGGFVRVESEIGRGTTFRVFLPAACDTKSGLPQESFAEQGTQPALNHTTIERIRSITRSSNSGLLTELVQSYINESSERLAGVQEAIAAGDHATLRFQARALKVSSQSIGAQSFARVCQEIERLAASDAASSAAQLLGATEAEFARAKAALMRELCDNTQLRSENECGAGV